MTKVDPLAKRLFTRVHGRTFEPIDPYHAEIVRLIDDGYLRRVDGRFLYERFKDSHVAWTPAGRTACEGKEGNG